MKRWKNWAGNQHARPHSWLKPRTTEEVAIAVKSARAQGRKVKVIGSGHSFTSAAVANDVLVDMSLISSCGVVDLATGTVEVGGGTTLAELNLLLHSQGRALANLGDIAYQTISGAISTSTHGTGATHTGMAAQVVGLTLVDGHGEVRRLRVDDAQDALFSSAQVGVGALGAITSVELTTVPRFALEAVETPMRLKDVLANLDEHVASNDHFEFFWIPHTGWALTKRNNRTDAPLAPMPKMREWYQKSLLENTAFGAVCQVGKIAPKFVPRLAKALPASGTTRYVDESYRVFSSARRVKFVEMEYAIPRETCTEVLGRITKMIDQRGFKIGFPVEVRFTAADTIPLSTSSERDSAYIAVHMFKGVDYTSYFNAVAGIMAEYAGRPHWGKMHFLASDELEALYPKWQTFQSAKRILDPEGTFENEYSRKIFGAL